MQSKWHVIYYETIDGESPIFNFIESRSPRNQAKILGLISLLEEKCPNLPRPFADLLDTGIHELRIKLSGEQIRILYFFCYKNYIVLTHCFVKKTSRVLKSEIKKAIKYREGFLNRINEEYLKELIDGDI